MSYDNFSVVDCDGHIVASVPEMAEYMSNRIKQHEIKEVAEREDLTVQQRQSILADNAGRFFNL